MSEYLDDLVQVLIIFLIVGVIFYAFSGSESRLVDLYRQNCTKNQFVFVRSISDDSRYFCLDPKNKAIVSEYEKKETK